MPHSIILTVAVTPNPSYSVILARPEIRLDHYRQAIRYWTKIAAERGFGLIIVETSGYQGELIPDENANTVGVKTSVVNFTPDVSSAMRGKGAVEADSLDYVINNSELGLRNTDTFYKVTFNPLYLELPLNLVVRLPLSTSANIFINGGAYIAAGIAGKSKFEGQLAGISGSHTENIKFTSADPNSDDQAYSKLKRFDYGLNVGAGLDLKKVLLKVNYGYGLAKGIKIAI